MSQKYERVNWVNDTTRVNADNLNKMDAGIEQAAKDISDLETKLTQDVSNINTELENKSDNTHNHNTLYSSVKLVRW